MEHAAEPEERGTEMKTQLSTLAAAAALALAAAAPGFAQSQLVASAGLTPEEAAGLSLTEIAQAKFDRDTDGQVIVHHGVADSATKAALAADAGLSPAQAQNLTLNQIAAVKFNRESSGSDQQTVQRSQATTAATRSADSPRARAQLIASAGLSPDAAASMSLTDIAAAKFDRDTD
jgi:hypothetical protein